jgi:hypothetical protein
MMPNTTRQIGQQSTATASFYNDSGTLTDPSTVTFLWRTAAGVETSYVYGTATEVTKLSTGVYQFVAPAYAAQGKHVVRVKSTGLIAANELAIGVQRSSFTTP